MITTTKWTITWSIHAQNFNFDSQKNYLYIFRLINLEHFTAIKIDWNVHVYIAWIN